MRTGEFAMSKNPGVNRLGLGYTVVDEFKADRRQDAPPGLLRQPLAQVFSNRRVQDDQFIHISDDDMREVWKEPPNNSIQQSPADLVEVSHLAFRDAKEVASLGFGGDSRTVTMVHDIEVLAPEKRAVVSDPVAEEEQIVLDHSHDGNTLVHVGLSFAGTSHS